MTEVAEEYNEHEVELEDLAIVGEEIRRLRDTRDQLNALKKIEKDSRAKLIQMLDERGGRVYDEQSGLEAVLTTKNRFEWDANLLRETGELKDEEIAACMVTTVDRKKIEALILKGTARERMLAPARVPVSSYEQIDIKEMADDRRLI